MCTYYLLENQISCPLAIEIIKITVVRGYLNIKFSGYVAMVGKQFMGNSTRVGSGTVMLLMGTKVDMVIGNPTRRQVTLEQARSLASLRHMIGVVETSAKEDTNISRTFYELAVKLREKHERVTSIIESEKSIHLSTVSVEEEKKCFCK